VWLDVVFNHTCEGSLGTGPILSWRGFDNAATYRLIAGSGGLVDDDLTGCGNAVDTRSHTVRRLIVETLVRWVEELGIDGFRFDLAATLIRGDDGPTSEHPLLAEIAARPELAGVKLVAEPWDLGLGGYVLGRFPEPWREWNDNFRDDIRDLARAHATLPAAASALTASAGAFGDRTPTATVNAAATHDGFTVRDLVTYDHAVGGGHGQRSWNGGREGPTDDDRVVAQRRRRQRMLLGLTVLAQGVPMLGSGDEIGRTQGGRADGYTLEAEQWGLPWPEADWDLAAWVARAVALRQSCAVLRRDHWVPPHDRRIQWFSGDGQPMDDEAWHTPHGRRARTDEQGGPTDDHPEWPRVLQVLFAPDTDPGAAEAGPAVLLVVVSGEGERDVVLPPGAWVVRLDAAEARSDGRLPAGHHETGRAAHAGSRTIVGPSLLVLTAGAPGHAPAG
jgi:glycogen operon protein